MNPNNYRIWLRILLHAVDEAFTDVEVKIGDQWYLAQQEGFRHASGLLISEEGEDYDITEIRFKKNRPV